MDDDVKQLFVIKAELRSAVSLLLLFVKRGANVGASDQDQNRNIKNFPHLTSRLFPFTIKV